ncbi:uncharacterized protein DUF3293 [Rhodococcus sp. OK302]|nr:uncharacterized protein DUF3293 [Rhodococcus sp. OK302]
MVQLTSAGPYNTTTTESIFAANTRSSVHTPTVHIVATKVNWAAITTESILTAIADHDRKGQQQFLSDAGFRPSKNFRLVHQGRFYSSKAIVGVANGHAGDLFLRSGDFTGGKAAVVKNLDTLGFVVDYRDEDGATGGLLWDLATTHTYTHTDGVVRAPYKYIVLLWAIARRQRGLDSAPALRDVRTELGTLLAAFAVADTTPQPEYPWIALDGHSWWEIHIPESLRDTPRRQLRSRSIADDLRGGLSQTVSERIDTDPKWTREAVALLTTLITESGAPGSIDELRSSLNLNPVPTPAVERHYAPKPSDPLVQHVKVTVQRRSVERNDATEFTTAAPDPEQERRALRREAALQNLYVAYRESRGCVVSSRSITIDDRTEMPTVLSIDVFDDTAETLIEAKVDVRRETLRTALGQILDYARHVPHQHTALLLPEAPTVDMTALLYDHGVDIITPVGTVVDSDGVITAVDSFTINRSPRSLSVLAADDQLWNDYSQAAIDLHLPTGTIRITPTDPVTDGDPGHKIIGSDILPDEPLHILAACHPGEDPESSTAIARYQQLREHLHARGYTIWDATGGSADLEYSEPSIVVSGLSDIGAMQIGADFGQVALFTLTRHYLTLQACTSSRTTIRRYALTR